MKNKSLAVCIVLCSFLNNGIAFAFGEGIFMKEIKLTQDKVALVDDADFEWLNQWKWCAANHGHTFYALANIKTSGKYKTTRMHRAILGLTDPKTHCDHVDGNGLNNQRVNLRKCTNQENTSNSASKGGTSKYKGVWAYPRSNKWMSAICSGGNRIYLGLFATEELAALAYNEAAIKHHGEFAKLNIINP